MKNIKIRTLISAFVIACSIFAFIFVNVQPFVGEHGQQTPFKQSVPVPSSNEDSQEEGGGLPDVEFIKSLLEKSKKLLPIITNVLQ